MMMTRIITADAVGNSPEPSDGEDKEEDDDSESDDDSDYEDAPTTVIHICIKNKRTKQDETFKALLDTGASNCLGTKAALQRAGLIQQLDKHPRRYGTAAGKFTTTHFTWLKSHRILELDSRRTLQKIKVRVAEGRLGDYDFILGRRYMNHYGIDLLFSDKTIRWDGMVMAMKEWAKVQEEKAHDN